jgi:hypothetical protein
MQKLPLGISSFETIRTDDYKYIDKTRYIYNLTKTGIYYFLSRPRRFGKSLLVSTLCELFKGKKELFEGLWIYNSDYKWKEHPVVVIDFNSIPHETPERLNENIIYSLNTIAEANAINLSAPSHGAMFKELIVKLKGKYNSKIVVLIDEYDKPIISHLGKGPEALEIAKQNRDFLKSFYGILKDNEVSASLKFVFITGVSKFSKVSIFSELNNLTDLSMLDDYSALLGYTQEELESRFEEHIAEFAKHLKLSRAEALAELKNWYNGYMFSKNGTPVYNPFSILNALNNKDLLNYWFESGTPAFLINLIKQNEYSVTDLESLELTESAFTTYDIDDLKIEALLFQTGYLTITGVRGETKKVYNLTYPNNEVRSSFTEHLLISMSAVKDRAKISKIAFLPDFLNKQDYNNFFETIKSIYAAIPYQIMPQKPAENYFHTAFYLMLASSGADVRLEEPTNHGRIDMTVEFKDKVFIIEFKCGQSAEAAIAQIKEKKYYEKYICSGAESAAPALTPPRAPRKIILIGVDFDTAEKNVREWKVMDFAV